MDRQYRIALYMRLSKEEGNPEEESGSIRTQRILLRGFVEAHFEGYRLYEFRDDGYSGTNLNRPGVSGMLDMVRASALDCIIVKDFSRFSRDYIELGSYLEQIFPFMGIRFISINDHYDSDRCMGHAGELDFCFRNLLYDLYSKDLSVKVKSSLAAGKARGRYISANCPFGYEKDPGDRHMLVVAEDEAEIVRRIFDMTLEGMTSARIAGILNAEGIRTPAEFKREKSGKGQKGKGKSMWAAGTICAILRNQVYTGDMVYGKTWKEEVGGRNLARPRSQWKVFPNHHMPVISREVFDRVQRGRGRKHVSAGGDRHPLSGFLTCACCGRNLYIRKSREPYFCCPGISVSAGGGCVRRLDAERTGQFVLNAVRQRAESTADAHKLWKKREQELAERIKAVRAERKKILAGRAALKRERVENYQGYTEKKRAGEIGKPAEEYQRIQRDLDGREQELERLLWENKEKEAFLEEQLSKKKDRAELLVYCEMDILRRNTVQRLIRKIMVRDDSHLEIFWNEDAAII